MEEGKDKHLGKTNQEPAFLDCLVEETVTIAIVYATTTSPFKTNMAIPMEHAEKQIRLGEDGVTLMVTHVPILCLQADIKTSTGPTRRVEDRVRFGNTFSWHLQMRDFQYSIFVK